jgi:CHAT domain
MRVLIAVSSTADDTYTVEATLAGGRQPLPVSKLMRRLDSAPWVAPAAEYRPQPGDAHAHLLDDPRARAELTRRLQEGEPRSGEVEAIGRYLFESLLGEELWASIKGAAARDRGTRGIELALGWSADQQVLHRPCWEAMHDGDDFLSAHPDLSVAVTRVIADADDGDEPPQISAPPRVLFVLGSDLDDGEIRAGAEVLGLLRDAERGEGAIDATVLQAATLERLGEKCRQLKPQIVHFVGHGRLSRSGRGEIELRKDEGEADGWADAGELLEAMETEAGLPTMAVVTGCDSAAAGPHMDSLAAVLVKGGIPCVVGMAGKISDPVCRLFSRAFGRALKEGKPLLQALADGRRAGLRRQAKAAADDIAWALPSVCLAPAVTGDYTPVDLATASDVLRRFNQYGLMSDPVFCGRSQLGQLFGDLLDPAKKLSVLVAYSHLREKLGKTRLQHEFAGRAVRAGHVVVMIDDWGNDASQLPGTPLRLAIEMLRKIAKTRQRFKLPPPEGSVLLKELERVKGESPDLGEIGDEEAWGARLEAFLMECAEADLEEKGIAGSLRPALSADLVRLIADARESPDPSLSEESRLVVILGGIGKWGTATDLVTGPLLEASGFGNGDEQIPVFATCDLADAEVPLTEARDRARPLEWVHYEKLEPFGEGEDTLAYRWVLLHPRIGEKFSLPAYAPNFTSREDEELWENRFREYIKGIPGQFEDPVLRAIVEHLHEKEILVKADDEDILRDYLEQQR